MILKPNNYTTVIKLPKKDINKIDFATCKEPKETLSSFYNRQATKPNYLINGGFFALNTGNPVFNYVDEGTVKAKHNLYKWGIGIQSTGELTYGSVDSGIFKDFISGYPCLIDGGKACKLDYAKEVDGRHPRSVLGYNKDYVFLIAVDGRQIGRPGMFFKELQDLCISLGIRYAIALDGGGSTRLMDKDTVLNKPTENRAVDNVVAVWLREKAGGDDTTPEKYKVHLDAGHSETTAGKRSPDGTLLEYEFNRDVALKIKAHLERHGVAVSLSGFDRENQALGAGKLLRVRTDKANAERADVFISVHANAASNDWSSANYWTAYCYRLGGQAERLAMSIYRESIPYLNELNATDRVKNNGNKPDVAGFDVLKYTVMPAVLIEHFFYTNRAQCELLKKQSYREKCALADAKGILGYLGIKWIEHDEDKSGEELAENVRTVQEKAGLDESTMEYLLGYKFKEELIKKLVRAMR